MKKTLTILLIITLTLGLVACDKDKKSSSDTKTNEQTTQQSTTDADTSDKPTKSGDKTETLPNDKKDDNTENTIPENDVLCIEQHKEIEVKGGKLACVIALPFKEEKSEKKYPVVLIVPGSGATPKDGIANGYEKLAGQLAKHDICSLRYDKRGMFDSSNIKVEPEKIRVKDLTDDIKVLIKNLNEDKRFDGVYIFGHSQGAEFGAIAAKDENIKGFISVEGAGRKISEVMVDQIKRNPFNPESVIEETETIVKSLQAGKVTEVKDVNLRMLFNPQIQNFWIDWMKLNPLDAYKNIAGVKSLIIQGKSDIQITTKDAELIATAMPDAKLVIIDNLSHILKSDKPLSEKPDKEEYKSHITLYGDNEAPVNEKLVQEIVSFVKEK